MAYEMSIEVLDGDFPAHLWMEARGDALVAIALQFQVIEWRWQHFGWGTVMEIVFADEADWERFRAAPAVQAALDAGPGRVSGLMIYRGRGGTCRWAATVAAQRSLRDPPDALVSFVGASHRRTCTLFDAVRLDPRLDAPSRFRASGSLLDGRSGRRC